MKLDVPENFYTSLSFNEKTFQLRYEMKTFRQNLIDCESSWLVKALKILMKG